MVYRIIPNGTNCQGEAQDITITVSSTLSVLNPVIESEFNIYPNPVKAALNLHKKLDGNYIMY